jgi:hypothetical protein
MSCTPDQIERTPALGTATSEAVNHGEPGNSFPAVQAVQLLPLARLYIRMLIYSPGELQSPHSTVDPKGNPMSTTTSAAPTPRVETFDEGLTVTFTDRGTGPFALRAHRELRPHATVRTAGAAAGAGARIRRDLGSLSRSGNIS